MEFQNRVVVVTGGAQGIGLAMVHRFQDEGAHVVAWDTDPMALRELPCEGRIVDVGDLSAIRAAANRLTRVDVLINNAGIGWPAGFADLQPQGWDRVLAVNLRAPWYCAKVLVPKIPPGGSIVNIASTRALMSEPETEPYAASKGGVVALTHALAVTLGDRGIRVNCISPGWIETRGHQRSDRRETPDLRPVDHAQHPAGRVGVPEDIAEAALFLASNRSGFTTGANWVIDGGMTRRMLYAEE